MASSDALPIPRKNAAYRVYFPMLKNDGTILTGWTSAAATISKDGGKWTDIGHQNGMEIYVHDATAGAAGNSENAYVMVAQSQAGQVHLNQDPPAH